MKSIASVLAACCLAVLIAVLGPIMLTVWVVVFLVGLAGSALTALSVLICVPFFMVIGFTLDDLLGVTVRRETA